MPGKKWRDLEGALNFVITQDLPAANTDPRASPTTTPEHCGDPHCDPKTRKREDPVTKRPAAANASALTKKRGRQPPNPATTAQRATATTFPTS